MRWLFWERLGRVLAYCNRHVPAGARVLDFGCGAGMLLPLLAARGYALTGVDIDLRLTPEYLKEFGVEGVLLCEPQQMGELPPASYDLVIALDVLEHIDDLDQTIDQLQRLLRPGASILVCGPTENILYKAGRWLSGIGSGTQNHYHVSNIADIQNTFERRFDTRTVATLVPLVPFFRLFVASARSPLAGRKAA
jgi:SAM-dependent methyltransferase